jgi:hypothetical protein
MPLRTSPLNEDFIMVGSGSAAPATTGSLVRLFGICMLDMVKTFGTIVH